MKLKVTLKDPDALYDGISEALEEDLKELPEDEKEALEEIRREKLTTIANKWFKWGEYITVEIDTDQNTCVVMPAEDL